MTEMQLYYSPRSPYVRKVLVVAGELGVADRIELLKTDVWSPDTEVAAVNPLGRIPALVTADAGVLFDSPVICDYLATTYGEGALLPQGKEGRWRTLRLQALADGLLDAAALRAVELRRRPASLRWPEWIERQRQVMTRTFDALETQVRDFADQIELGQIAVACALAYVDLRFPDDRWRENRPSLESWYRRYAERTAFRDTAPPD